MLQVQRRENHTTLDALQSVTTASKDLCCFFTSHTFLSAPQFFCASMESFYGDAEESTEDIPGEII